MQKKFADIVFPATINRAFTYRIPPDLLEVAKIGCRVMAPFGVRKLTGFIVAIKEVTELKELKELQDVLDLQPIVSDELLHLAQWISDYYLCSLGDTLKATIPSNLLHKSKKMVEPSTEQAESVAKNLEKKAPRQAQILRYLSKSGKLSVEHLKKRIGARSLFSSLNQLERNGLVRIEHVLEKTKVKPKFLKYVKLNSELTGLFHEIESLKKTAPKQAACLQYLQVKNEAILLQDLMQQTGVSLSSLKALEKKKLVNIVKKEVLRDFYQNTPLESSTEVTLNVEQKQALKQIEAAIAQDHFETFLLYGVTGSGKTQVYIEAIYKVLEKGKDAIVLVPEISLTPQTVQRFRSHFKEKVAVLHSAMSHGERFDSWRRLKDGTAKVAIGPRSAVFAPLNNIGLIVVDEEHEGSYKQSDSIPRYHARDVAVMRAKFANAVVILGSATPSAESYYNAKIHKYRLLRLERRIDDVPLPEVNILDLLKEKRLSGKKEQPTFSRMLAQKIEQKLARNEQIILLLNRRGFSSYIKCKECGFIENCESCNITLTYHLKGHRLRCHYCGFTKRAPNVCPECSGTDIVFRGLGTQKVEQALKTRFPLAKVVRMD
ncbi:MAG: primosomal protein N', partial [bacterium]